MKVSVCITTFNEARTITKLLDSLFKQTRKPDEIVIVDGGSTDRTTELILKFKKVKLIVSKRASIAMGRNLAVGNANYPIIAMTDAGCVCERHWLERITKPLNARDFSTTHPLTRVLSMTPDVVAGFYKMAGNTNFQEALKPFLGVMPSKFNEKTFLPSTRSIAFRKSVWEKVGGFNEKLDKAGEDTEFNLQIISKACGPSGVKNNFKIERKKTAIVYWEVPDNLTKASKKFFYYSRGDAQIGGITKHNIHSMSLILRYLILGYLRFLIPFYLIWAVWKHRKFTENWRQRIYTVIIQVVSDFAVMGGFIWGTLNK